MNVIGASVSEAIYASHETRDIVLPNQTEHASQIAVDIGGSLAKVTYFTPSADRKGGRLHFKKFESGKVDEYIDYIVHLFENAQHYNNSSQQVL